MIYLTKNSLATFYINKLFSSFINKKQYLQKMDYYELLEENNNFAEYSLIDI